MRNHPADRAFNQQFRMALPTGANVLGFVSPDVSREAHVAFLFFFLAGEPNFFGIDDDNEVAGIDMGGIDGLFLSAEKIGCLDGHLTEHLIIGVDDPPLTGHFAGFSRKRLHWVKGHGKYERAPHVSTAYWTPEM